MGEGIVVDGVPVAVNECTDEQQQCGLRLMEIGHHTAHDMVLIARGDDNPWSHVRQRPMSRMS